MGRAAAYRLLDRSSGPAKELASSSHTDPTAAAFRRAVAPGRCCFDLPTVLYAIMGRTISGASGSVLGQCSYHGAGLRVRRTRAPGFRRTIQGCPIRAEDDRFITGNGDQYTAMPWKERL